jgi:hypothetical protein
MKRDATCSGWCTSPTRCSSQARSYDFTSSDAPGSESVARRAAICVLTFGVAAYCSAVPSGENG